MIYIDIGLEYQSHQLLLNPTVNKPLSLQMLGEEPIYIYSRVLLKCHASHGTLNKRSPLSNPFTVLLLNCSI